MTIVTSISTLKFATFCDVWFLCVPESKNIKFNFKLCATFDSCVSRKVNILNLILNFLSRLSVVVVESERIKFIYFLLYATSCFFASLKVTYHDVPLCACAESERIKFIF